MTIAELLPLDGGRASSLAVARARGRLRHRAARPASVALPFVLAWVAAPALVYWLSRSARSRTARMLDRRRCRQACASIARRTWLFFETFVTAEDNWLPPDNYQERPQAAIAHRTSPTNIGLYLLSIVSARDFGWIGLTDMVERLEADARHA